MLSLPSRGRPLALGALCAVAGAGAGTVAVAGASSPHRPAGAATHAAATAGGRRHGRRGALLRRTVHGELVVRTRSGFVTATVDRGTVDSVSGDQLTMTDGTPRSNWQQQTITVGTAARVRNDRQTASLSSLQAGERVLVVQLPQRTVVIARTPKTDPSAS